ncbi:MAG: amino acid permease [Verrucomicrobiaceae bacterium]|nr:amino acid permease [Verrucomicrobiaceae bacterium]
MPLESDPRTKPPAEPALIRGLGLRDATALVIGTIIGTGVFLKMAPMAQAVGSPWLALLAWIAAGLLSLAGALSYAELGALMPSAGGEYVYLRAAYGDLVAFLFGWMRILIGASGSIAIFGVAFATFLSSVVPLDAVWARRTMSLFGQTTEWEFGMKQIVAIAAILLLSVLNCRRVTFAGKTQTLLTIAKVAAIGGIVAGVFFFSKGGDWSHLRTPAGTPAWSGLQAFGLAMLAALWAYDGWNNMPMVAGEVKDPQRNVPRALILGMFIVLLVYGLVNLAYCYALPIDEIQSSNSSLHRDALPVAAKAARTFLGDRGPQLISLAFLLSTIGVLHGSILTNARIPYALAKDGLFFRRFARLSDKTSVPVSAIALQAVWASVLAASGTFDQLTNYVVFAGWIFYAATTSAVFVLRKKMSAAPRPYRTPGYPFIPVVFILVAVALLVNTLITARLEALLGLALIALGLPVYVFFRLRGGPH